MHPGDDLIFQVSSPRIFQLRIIFRPFTLFAIALKHFVFSQVKWFVQQGRIKSLHLVHRIFNQLVGQFEKAKVTTLDLVIDLFPVIIEQVQVFKCQEPFPAVKTLEIDLICFF